MALLSLLAFTTTCFHYYLPSLLLAFITTCCRCYLASLLLTATNICFHYYLLSLLLAVKVMASLCPSASLFEPQDSHISRLAYPCWRRTILINDAGNLERGLREGLSLGRLLHSNMRFFGVDELGFLYLCSGVMGEPEDHSRAFLWQVGGVLASGSSLCGREGGRWWFRGENDILRVDFVCS